MTPGIPHDYDFHFNGIDEDAGFDISDFASAGLAIFVPAPAKGYVYSLLVSDLTGADVPADSILIAKSIEAVALGGSVAGTLLDVPGTDSKGNPTVVQVGLAADADLASTYRVGSVIDDEALVDSTFSVNFEPPQPYHNIDPDTVYPRIDNGLWILLFQPPADLDGVRIRLGVISVY